MAKKLLIKVLTGSEDAERTNQAFTVAASAVASGAEVSLWLAGEAAWYALPGRAEEFSLPLATPLEELLTAVVEGGTVTLCTQCAERRGITTDDVRTGIKIAGAATFTEQALTDGTQAIVY